NTASTIRESWTKPATSPWRWSSPPKKLISGKSSASVDIATPGVQTPPLLPPPMKYIEVVASATSRKTLAALAVKVKALDCRIEDEYEDHMSRARLLVSRDRLQQTLDTLHTVLGAQDAARVVVLNIDS